MLRSVGQSVLNVTKNHKDRYFYGLRRTDEGELWLGKVDQMTPGDSVTINNPGAITENFDGWSEGQEFFDGRDVNHDRLYANLKYEQFRWDSINVTYYINAEGELVMRINHPIDGYNYTYPNLSELPISTGPSVKWDQDTLTFDNNEISWDKT